MADGEYWSHAQNLSLLDARLRDISWEAISEDTGRTIGACKQQLQKVCRLPRYADRAAGLTSRNTVYSKRGNLTDNLPVSLIEDRDRRMGLRFAREASNTVADTTATFFGDPPKGYSARDRKSGVGP